jgi:aspartyl aminopeptidase
VLNPGDPADLIAFIDASPSPYHAVAEATRRLEATGFTVLDELEPFPTPGRHLIVRGGSLVAWDATGADRLPAGVHLVGAHTDSPNLRLKPNPDLGRVGWQQLAVEVYGGALWNSWLDRDLGLSGRVAVRSEGSASVALVRDDRGLAHIPQLAVHLDRTVNSSGLTLDPQFHLSPVWGLGDHEPGALRRHVAELTSVSPGDVLGWDLMLHDVQPASLAGRDGELVSASRIDNLASCWAAITALTRTSTAAGSPVPVVCLFDHEEIGSQSTSGADSSLLPTILRRLAASAGVDDDEFGSTMRRSLCISADGAHAMHPNYAERHDPGHPIRPGAGPALKHNANQRYATDAATGAQVVLVAERAGVGLQHFVSRNEVPCGSTIGPVTSALLGIPTADVGIPQLAMHSARELCAAADAASFVALLEAHLSPART